MSESVNEWVDNVTIRGVFSVRWCLFFQEAGRTLEGAMEPFLFKVQGIYDSVS